MSLNLLLWMQSFNPRVRVGAVHACLRLVGDLDVDATESSHRRDGDH